MLKKDKQLLKDNALSLPSSDLQRLICVTALIFIAMTAMRPKLFLTVRNFVSMGYQIPELGFYSLAMMMVMVTNGRDLSIVYIGNLCGILAAFIMRGAAENGAAGLTLAGIITLAVAAALAVGFLCGLVNGVIISKFNVPPMLATMATSWIYLGIGIVITDGEAVSGLPAPFLYFGQNTLFGVPIPLWMLIAALLFTSFLLNRTKFGYEAKMVGANQTASRYSGIDTVKVLIKTYIFSGVMCAVCGLEIISRTDSAKADYAFTYVFQAILAAVLGATNPNGGFAKISCMALSLISLQFLSSGFNLLRLGGFYKQFTWGLLLILVLLMDVLIERGRRRRSVLAVSKAHMEAQKLL